ncbi:divalent-cation tolerance protein CutA [Candidatus Saccharibacteria bacterium]|nr:divalent-cation tolerance protein CutA [Candidatus Saccharibacteria bacterium]
MKSPKYYQLWLTVGSKEEADKIANTLLFKHLVACVRQIPVSSDFWWKGKIDHSNEILLQMESREDLFSQVEMEVAKLHSYSTFVLETTPVSAISKSAEKWLKSELKNG